MILAHLKGLTMTRISKKSERRGISPRKAKKPAPKSGPKKDNLPKGFKEHDNACPEGSIFIPKIK
jgi:hypothetical protein